ncbi:MAG: hypothetical protein E3J40_04315 [Dehalococcoidia bacterium]|nr:MAG: hypothetical protein E3J40_04315 [Dehalococcoidia bacterium]
MQADYIQYSRPQFRILSDKQIEELHFATLQILERTGVTFECQEAIDILADAGADISDTNRVKIPSYLVEKALKTAPKTITLYSRDGEPAIVLNGQTGSHFGSVTGYPQILDPYTRKRRLGYVEDVADMARLSDALPNIERVYTGSPYKTLPAAIADEVSLLQTILNTSKPVGCWIMNGASSLKEMIDLCSMVAGGEEQLRKKPFFMGSSQPVSPLIQGKDAMEKSLLCAEKGIPNFIYPMPMAGATTPATLPACVAISNAEVLSQLVVLQLKNPGAPIIIGSFPSIMDMKTTIFATGAPELSVMLSALTELGHYYGLPVKGEAGLTDAEVIGAQAAAEITYQIIISALSGADLVHNVGLMYHSTITSPELIVLADEIIGMVRVLMRGMEINSETLPLDLIERLGPKSSYLSESHTFNHFRKFWVPTIFDRSFTKTESVKDCEELLNQKTIEILETHKPKPLPEDLVKELKKMEKTWFDRVGLKHEYPKRKT